MYSFLYLFLIFFFYSIIGYIVEVTSCALVTKKFTISRGYLIGPYIPVFGFGAVFMTSFLSKYSDDIINLFILSMVVCCVVEYFTSLLMEKIFKLRWWDYSNQSFNINGRICLKNGVLFGIGGVVITKYFHPLLLMFLNSFSIKTIIIMGWVFFGIMILDTVISTFTISKLKIDTKKYVNTDATAVVKEQVAQSLRKYNIFYKRLIRAFPNIHFNANIVKIMEFMDEQRKNTLKLLKINEEKSK